MQSSKKNMAIIALVIILAASNVALAVLYMTKNVNISGGVSVLGAIELYEEDGVTPFTSYDFPLFTGGTVGNFFKYFFINNTGNQPVYVYWNISSSSITWGADAFGYYHAEGGYGKYYFQLYNATTTFAPKEYVTPGVIHLDVGAGQRCYILLNYQGSPNTAETFTLVMTFYAQDA